MYFYSLFTSKIVVSVELDGSLEVKTTGYAGLEFGSFEKTN